MKFFLPVALIFAAFASLQAEEGGTKGSWSPVVNGLRARLCFAEGQASHGDQFPEVYLELENVAQVINPIEFEFDADKSLHFELCTAEGKAMPNTLYTWAGDGFSCGPYRLTIPHGGILRFPVTWGGFAVPENFGTILRFQEASWEIAYSDHTPYFLTVTLEIPRTHADPSKSAPWSGSIKAPAVQAPTSK